jgi:3-oxoadipate enol-lactonase
MLEHTTDDGCRLAFRLDGPVDAPLLVLSNSLGTDHSLWTPQLDVLAAHHRVLRYDARGHGASAAPTGDYSIERLGRDVVSLLGAVGAARAHVAGISIGGLTALWLGIQVPERVDRLVLANTAARIGTRDLWDERRRVATTEGLESLADAAMGRWFTEAFRIAQPDTIDAMRDTFRRGSPTGYAGCCAALRDTDLRALAPGVTAPTLVVTGLRDPATPPEEGRWLAGAIHGAQLVEFDAAHLTNVECAAVFTAAVDGFLRA